MIPPNAQIFEKPYVLMCEGVGDLRFFHYLFEARQIGQKFSIRHPYNEGKYNGGRTNFGVDLNAISVSESFIENVRAALIISDTDDDEGASFAQVQTELRKAKVFGIPDQIGVASKQANAIKTVVMLLPMGRSGNLESLCLEAAYAKWPLKSHLDQFVLNCPANDWVVGKQAKMRLQTILAATNKKRPDAGFAGHWSKEKEYCIPLEHSCFDGLATFIKNFDSLI